MADRFIAVAGNMGVGKTTLVAWLTARYGIQPVFEPFADNPYLDDFYRDMSGWGFHSQVWFLAHKYRLHRDLERTAGVLVQDRTIYEDAEIFAAHLHRSKKMSKRDWETYSEMYRAMRASLKPPDLLIYLRCGVRTIRKRLVMRGRPSEQEIPTAYLRSLNQLYEGWIASYDQSPVLIWDTERLDYLGDLVDSIEFQKALEPVLWRPG